MTRRPLPGRARTRTSRVAALSVVSAVALASVTGCGATRAVLGIHQAPEANPAAASLSIQQAEKIVTRAFTAAQQGETTKDAGGIAARGTAYTDERLRAAVAGVRLAAIQPAVVGSPLLTPAQPRVLAVSRGFGFPRVIVAQTVGGEGSLPILHLLTSPNARTPYRISASATMLPATSVKPFDPLVKGSPLVTDGTGLAVSGAALMQAYAAGMAFPAKAVSNPPFASDTFFTQVRAGSAAAAKALAVQANFSQAHVVVPGSVQAVRQADGGALVFGVMQRTDTFTVKPTQAVSTVADKAFVLLTGKKKITKSASITTLEFVVFAVPAVKGPAVLLATAQQVVAGSGS